MIKKLALSLALTAAFAAAASADVGIFAGYAVLDINGNNDQFYKLQNPNDTTNPTFQGADLGTFDPNVNSLFFSGGELQTFENGGSDVTGASIHYRVYVTGSPTGSYTSFNLPYAGAWGSTAGDDRWQSLAPSDNLLSNLAPGSYTLETFISASSTDGSLFLSNGGSNYQATFTVVPEPSTVSLLAGPAILGAWFFVRRRRA